MPSGAPPSPARYDDPVVTSREPAAGAHHPPGVVPLRSPGPGGGPGPDPIADERLSDVDEWGRSERMRSLARTLYEPVYSWWFRAEWEGLREDPGRRPRAARVEPRRGDPVRCPGHHARDREGAGTTRVRHGRLFFRTIPVVGTLWSRVGGVPARQDNGYRLLHEQRRLVLVFPEGTKGPSKSYTDRYQLRRFGRGGFVEIAMRAGVPVIPIAVIGAEETMPVLTRLPALARVLGAPLLPRDREHAPARSARGRAALSVEVQAASARPGHLRRPERPGPVPEEQADGGGRADPRPAPGPRSTTCCASGAASGSVERVVG